MFNVTTGIILKINPYCQERNIILLTDNSGIKTIPLTKLNQYLHNYHLLDVWTFIFNVNNHEEVWVPYEKILSFKQLQNNHDILKLIYYFNKIVINSERKYHNNTTFQFLLNYYQLLICNYNNLEKIYCLLLFHTLPLQGIQFNFKNCINCEINNNIIDFNPKLGGVICHSCLDYSPLATNNLSLFNHLMQLDTINNWHFTEQELKYIINVLESHCQKYNGIPILNIKKSLFKGNDIRIVKKYF